MRHARTVTTTRATPPGARRRRMVPASGASCPLNSARGKVSRMNGSAYQQETPCAQEQAINMEPRVHMKTFLNLSFLFADSLMMAQIKKSALHLKYATSLARITSN